MKRITRRRTPRLAVVGLLTLAALSLVAAPGMAAQTAEERGATVLAAVNSGQRTCQDLSSDDVTAIGEFAMGRMLGSPQAHESMDELAIRMMGSSGLERMHQVMGQRFAACGQPDFPGGFALMMGMMPGMGGGFGPQGIGLMMGGQGYGPGDQATGGGAGAVQGGPMMNGGRDSNSDGGIPAWMAVVMLVLIVGAGALVFLLVRPRSQRRQPLEILAQRLARGEISDEEYAQQRRLLEGGHG